jgi:hypothetical protein
MKLNFLYLCLFAACSQKQNIVVLNQKVHDPIINFSCDNIQENDSTILKKCTYFNGSQSVELRSEMSNQNILVAGVYTKIIKTQSLTFKTIAGLKIKTVDICSQPKVYFSETNKINIGVDNFIYKIYSVLVDSSFVYVLNTIGFNSKDEIIEHTKVFTNEGAIVFDGYLQTDYAVLETYWKTKKVRFEELQNASKQALMIKY